MAVGRYAEADECKHEVGQDANMLKVHWFVSKRRIRHLQVESMIFSRWIILCILHHSKYCLCRRSRPSQLPDSNSFGDGVKAA